MARSLEYRVGRDNVGHPKKQIGGGRWLRSVEEKAVSYPTKAKGWEEPSWEWLGSGWVLAGKGRNLVNNGKVLGLLSLNDVII